MNIYIIPNHLKEEIIVSQIIRRANAFRDLYDVNYKLISRKKFNNDLKITHIESRIKFWKLIKRGDILYIRSVTDYLFFFPFRLKGIKIIYDFRGFLAYESFLKHKSFIKFFIFFALEFFCYHTANQIFTVSHFFASTLQKKFLFPRNIDVIPSLISKDIDIIESTNIKTSKKIKFVYIGGLSKWQNINKILEIFEAISQNINSSLDIITMDIDSIREILINCKMNNKDNIKYFSIKQNEISTILQNYDYGFLIRDNLLLNKVSSPIKFLEYYASGVIPIISDYVGDFSNLVMKTKIGFIYREDKSELVNQIAGNDKIDIMKKNALEIAKQYNWNSYLKNKYFKYKI
jgi:hypothetical protein